MTFRMHSNNALRLAATLTVALRLSPTADAATPTGTGFTYQGQLKSSGVSVTGACSFTFKLFDASTIGIQKGSTLTYDGLATNPAPLAVTNGIFTTSPPLDFGNVFNGDERWLEIQVKCGADPGYTLLGARQKLTGTPYSISTQSLQGSPVSQIPPVANQVLQWNGSTWIPSSGGSTLIPFSTGVIRNGPTVVFATPLLMGFGNSTVETINGLGESTSPTEAAGFSFPIPFNGTIQNLQVSSDLLVTSVSSINFAPLQYVFTVFRAPSVPNNGIGHLAQPYQTTALTSSLAFGGFANPVVAGTFQSATNQTFGSIAVLAGDRIGVRIRTAQASDTSALDINQLSFSATLTYTPSAP